MHPARILGKQETSPTPNDASYGAASSIGHFGDIL
jgi:hypothetical protein